MKPKIDQHTDALYLRMDESKIVESQEAAPGVVLDLNEKGDVVGIEILHLFKRFPADNLKELLFQTRRVDSLIINTPVSFLLSLAQL